MSILTKFPNTNNHAAESCEAFVKAVRRVKKQTVHLIGMYKTPKTKFTFNGERLAQ